MTSLVKSPFFAVVNPTAGHGRCGKSVGIVLNDLYHAGIELEIVKTEYPGHGVELVKDAYRLGYRRFLARRGRWHFL